MEQFATEDLYESQIFYFSEKRMRNEKKIRERKVKNTSLANPATPANFVNRATQWLRLALMQPRKRFIRGVKAESLLLLLIFIFLNNPGFGEARYDWAWDPLDTHDCSKYSHEELAKMITQSLIA